MPVRGVDEFPLPRCVAEFEQIWVLRVRLRRVRASGAQRGAMRSRTRHFGIGEMSESSKGRWYAHHDGNHSISFGDVLVGGDHYRASRNADADVHHRVSVTYYCPFERLALHAPCEGYQRATDHNHHV